MTMNWMNNRWPYPFKFAVGDKIKGMLTIAGMRHEYNSFPIYYAQATGQLLSSDLIEINAVLLDELAGENDVEKDS